MDNIFSKKSIDELSNTAIKSPLNLPLLAYMGHQAPSVHNTQPWEILIDSDKQTIRVMVSKDRLLEHSDPTKRQTWISIGAFVQNIYYLCEALEIKIITSPPRGSEITLNFKISSKKPSVAMVRNRIGVILERHTNRNDFSKQKVKTAQVKIIKDSEIDKKNIKTVFVENRKDIDKLSRLSEEAARIAFSNQDLKKELDRHINKPFRPKDSGIPASTLSSSLRGRLKEQIINKSTRFANINSKRERQRMENSGLIACIFSQGDTKEDWYSAGREYENICLKTTENKLAHSTAAMLVEAPEFYKEVAQILGQKKRLQAIVRIGYATPMKNRSSRLPLSKVVTYS